jgi:lysophospholipase L1-like esterase
VLLLGDSIAYDEAPAVLAALRAGGLKATTGAGPGGGLLDRATPGVVAHFVNLFNRRQPDLVIYQLSLWDTGTVDEQRAAYQSFADLVIGAGASLVFVTPPVVSSQHVIPSLPQLDEVVAAVAATHPDQIRVIDLDDAWGGQFVEDLNSDGVPERKPDGVHMCPSGAAFTAEWIAAQIAALTGAQPAPPESWVAGGWAGDSRYPSDLCPR